MARMRRRREDRILIAALEALCEREGIDVERRFAVWLYDEIMKFVDLEKRSYNLDAARMHKEL